MKKTGEKILRTVSKLTIKAAQKTSTQISYLGWYEPKQPEKLREMMEKK